MSYDSDEDYCCDCGRDSSDGINRCNRCKDFACGNCKNGWRALIYFDDLYWCAHCFNKTHAPSVVNDEPDDPDLCDCCGEDTYYYNGVRNCDYCYNTRCPDCTNSGKIS